MLGRLLFGVLGLVVVVGGSSAGGSSSTGGSGCFVWMEMLAFPLPMTLSSLPLEISKLRTRTHAESPALSFTRNVTLKIFSLAFEALFLVAVNLPLASLWNGADHLPSPSIST